MDKVMFVSNPYAGSVSRRTKEVIVKALEADFKLEVAETTARNHASELARDAVDRDFEAVVVFGGDGTINEAAQGLVGTDVALGVLPGGSTNVMARALGVPRDPVDATSFVAHHVRSGTKKRINVGKANDRFFLFSAGMGLDAEVVRRVEADPEGKRKNHEALFIRNAFKAGLTEYRRTEPFITQRVDDESPFDCVTSICCNASPFTYYRKWPVDLCPQARLDKGLDFFGLASLGLRTVPRLVYSLFVSRSHTGWRTARYRHDAISGSMEASRPAPLQLDGDYVGRAKRVRLSLVPSALDLLI